MDSNQSGAVGGIILGVFQGSLTHLGASRRLQGQKYIKARPILGHILTFLDPPCQPGQIFLVQNSLYRVSQKKRTFRMLLEEEEPQGPWRQKHSWIFPRSAFGAEAYITVLVMNENTGCPKKNALSELCRISVRTKFFGYFGYFEQASLQPSF